VRQLKGLESIIDVYQVHHLMGPDGFFFSGEGDALAEDPLHPGFTTMKQLYLKADPSYQGRYTVPMLWDKKKDVPVNNESSEIIRMLALEFDDLLPAALREDARPGGGLYPDNLRAAIDELNGWVYDTVNNGVYKVGFARSQAAYDENVAGVFASLDRLEAQLGEGGGRRFLLGAHLTEADVRLYTTLARFDAAYGPVMQCTLRTIRHGYPRLHRWLRRLYWDRDGDFRGAFGDTTAPMLDKYATGYAHARYKIVFGEAGPLIVPALPPVDELIPPLTEAEVQS
jgi:glutathionyl-hydroquinone reductase